MSQRLTQPPTSVKNRQNTQRKAVKMAENSSKVLVASYVRIVNMDSKTDDRVFESSVQVLCGYDPQGVNVKLIKGRLK